MIDTPFQEIKESLLGKIPTELIEIIPEKWEKIGDVLIFVLSPKLNTYKQIISEKYAEILKCKTVLNDIGGIYSEYRVPHVEFIYGSNETVTIHKENGIKYKLDPLNIMFSSGNMNERIRMAKISNKSEIVVDLFAGIGYFTLPIAVYSKPKKIFACEKNKISYDYLCDNIVLNNILDIVQPIKGDNRKVAPKNVANRIIMGYIGDTYKFLPTAFKCLKDCRGIIHYHDKYPEEIVPDKPLRQIQEIADDYNRFVKLINYKRVKTFAPGISHFVFDIKLEEK